MNLSSSTRPSLSWICSGISKLEHCAAPADGKDLTEIPALIGAGGIFAYGRYPELILKAALFDARNPASLRPKNPRFYRDANYILYGVGLLSGSRPEPALKIAKKYLLAISHGIL